jgi:transcriptional regulator PpsR
MILDAGTERLEEANPAAYKLLGDDARRSAWTWTDSLDSVSVNRLQQMLARLRTSGRTESVELKLLANAAAVTATISLFRQENSTHLLVRLSTLTMSAVRADDSSQDQLLKALESAPDAFVVTDLSGHVLTANRAFLELTQVASADQARGESLEKWLGRSSVDLNVLIANLRQRGAVRLFATRVKGNYGSMADVEISGVAVNGGEQPCLGFTIRDVGRRLPSDARANKELPRSAGQMTELVGRVPLRDIVRETTDLIERLCIEAALELTSDNRASAAEMLGLSRQSLYIKLRRFGIGDQETPDLV